jgi:hypothetical protein
MPVNPRSVVNPLLTLVAGAGIGAGLVYLTDPHYGGTRQMRRLGLLQDKWPPAARVTIGTAAGILLMKGLTRGLVGILMSASGLYLLARAATNLPPRRLFKATAQKALQLHEAWPAAAK